jgi:hypothetical protein
MLKRFAWLGKLIAAGLILSFLSIWTTGYIVTSYVESVLKQFNLPLEVPPMTMTGVWGKLWGSDPLLESEVAGKGEPDGGTDDSPLAIDAFGQEQDPPITGMGVGGGTEANGGAGTQGSSTEEGAAGANGEASGGAGTDAGEGNGPDSGLGSGTDGAGSSSGAGGEAAGGDGDSSAVGSGNASSANGSGAGGAGGASGGSGSVNGNGADGTETAMTSEELTEVKQQMSSEDKEKLFALLMSKLPQETWQTISEYVENGLTEQELTDIQQIMAQHLDKQEYEQMMSILKKY